MKTITIDQSVPVFESYRATRVRSLFNVGREAGSRFVLRADLPLDDDGWQIGLIVGPSGSGKSSLGKACWPDGFHQGFSWGSKPIIDEIGRIG